MSISLLAALVSISTGGASGLAPAAAPSRFSPALYVTVGAIVPDFRPIALAAAPFGTTFAASMEDGSVRIIDSKTHATVRVLRKHLQPAYALAFSNSGKLLATGDESGRVWIENIATGAAVRGYRCHTKGVQKLSFNAFDNLLISTGKDDQVNVYDLKNKQPKESKAILGHGENFYSAVFNPQSTRQFMVGMLGGGMRMYDAITGNVLAFFQDSNGQGTWDVAYSPNGTRVVSAGRDGNALVWDNKTGKELCSLKGHQDWVMDATVSPNGKLAATSSTDRTVKIWNLHSYAKVADLSQQCAVGSPLCFTADGGSLISVTDMGFLQFNALNPAQGVDVDATTKRIGRASARRRHQTS